ncbi:MAG: response regulator transcription factor [Thermoanaerobaculaceae bacterium]|nr:response regulator transcription factor [Thermoanaerobaculaceae bacterium]
MPLRVLIADDHGVLRAGLRALLKTEEGLQVVDEAADGETALRLASRLRPDIVLLDLSMPGPGGIEVTRKLKEMLPATRVLILTVHEDETLLREALNAGASGYIIKRAVESELISAIHAVSRGEIYVHPAMTRWLLKGPAPAAPKRRDPAALTPREIEVLRLIAQGHTNSQVAEVLRLSVRTIESHRANLMGKLGLQSRVELVRYAVKNKLLD